MYILDSKMAGIRTST